MKAPKGKAEQLGKFSGPGERRHHKRMANKARRRLEKLDPENAPTKQRHLYRGWSD